MKTFDHGGGVGDFAREIDCNEKEVIDLSSNINFLKPKIEIDFNSLEISSYPTYEKLYKEIANNYQVNIDELELFNGGSSAIFSFFRFLNLKYCTIYSPAYLEYKKASLIFSYEVRLINRFENIYLPVKENSLVVFVNPSTPDGKYYEFKKLFSHWINRNCTILIDESFLDFCEKKSMTEYINKYEKLYILKSMTKFYSSAGVRVGAIISNKNNIKKMTQSEALWKLSVFDSYYLQHSLKDKNFKTISKAVNIKNKIELENILKDSIFVEYVYESVANFILVKLKNIKAKEFQNKLKPYKILIRDCSNFDFLDDSFIRVAVKSAKINKIFKKALEKIC